MSDRRGAFLGLTIREEYVIVVFSTLFINFRVIALKFIRSCYYPGKLILPGWFFLGPMRASRACAALFLSPESYIFTAPKILVFKLVRPGFRCDPPFAQCARTPLLIPPRYIRHPAN